MKEVYEMAGDHHRQKSGGEPGVVFTLDASAHELMPMPGIDTTLIRAKEETHPDSMRVHPVWVDKNLCVHCLACLKVCPTLSWDYDKGQVVVNDVSCKGCGVCGSVCPAGAISQRQFSTGMVFDILDTLWGGNGGRGEVQSCALCPVEALSLSTMVEAKHSDNEVRLLCSGRMEPLYVLESSRMGLRGVVMIDCFANVREKDRFERAKRRLEQGSVLLKTLGVEDFRVESVKINHENMQDLPKILKKFTTRKGGAKK